MDEGENFNCLDGGVHICAVAAVRLTAADEFGDDVDRRPVPVAVTPRVLQLGAHSFDVERGMMTRGTDPVRLTATEVGLLRILAARLEKTTQDLYAARGGH